MTSVIKRTTTIVAMLATATILTILGITSLPQDADAHDDPIDNGKAGPAEAPQNLRTGTHDWDRVTLHWDAVPEGFSEQQVGIRHIGHEKTLSWTTIAADVTSHTVTGLEPHNTYAFRVRVLRDDAYYQSNYVNFETAHDQPPPTATPLPTETPQEDPPTPPPAPALGTPASATTDSVTLSWAISDTTDLTGFSVGVRSAGEGEYAYRSVSGTGGTLPYSHTVTGLTAATSYQFRIRAHKETNGVSAHSDSNEITITTDDYHATVQTTASITVEDDASGTVERAGDRDWFAATLEAGTSYQFELHASRSRGLGDPMIHGIRNSNGELLPNTSNDNASWFYWYSQVFFTPQAAGDYYISAGASGEGVGAYVLSVDVIADDYAANTGTTGMVSAATPATGEVNSAHEEDWFRVAMDGTKNYRLQLNGAPQGGGTLAEPEIVGVFDAQGTLGSVDI